MVVGDRVLVFLPDGEYIATIIKKGHVDYLVQVTNREPVWVTNYQIIGVFKC